MPPVYITEQGTKIRIHNNCIRVERENGQDPEMLYQAPISTVSQLILAGNVGITTPAIGTFLSRQIDVVFLDSHGNFRGRLLSEADPHTLLRKAQYHAAENKTFPLNMARCLVRAKLKHQHAFLQRQNRSIHDDEISKQKALIKTFEERMEQRHVHPATHTSLTLRQCMLEQARQIAECCVNYEMSPDFKDMGFR